MIRYIYTLKEYKFMKIFNVEDKKEKVHDNSAIDIEWQYALI